MKTDSISDSALVLARVNYRETDRILTVLCQSHGKLSVIAKGVRAGKSKLAGGVELFAENELVLLRSKGDMYILTSSRMKEYFGDISKDFKASSYVYECLKAINKLVPEGAGEEYFIPLLSLLKALKNQNIPLEQVRIWFSLKLLQNLGSLPNFNTDKAGKRLRQDSKFLYDFDKHCFFIRDSGIYTSDHIKILRHLADSQVPVEIKVSDSHIIAETENLAGQILQETIS